MAEVTTKITLVVNRTAAPFALSEAAQARLSEMTGKDASSLGRDDHSLIRTVTSMGPDANGPGCDLRVVTVPIVVEIETDGDAEEVSVRGEAYEV